MCILLAASTKGISGNTSKTMLYLLGSSKKLRFLQNCFFTYI